MDELPMGLRFSIIHRHIRKAMDERLREKDLTGVQLGVLSQLERLEHDGATEINQRELEKAARVTHPTMTEIVKRLEKKGFISCEVSSSDHRSKSISTTSKAAALRREIDEGGEAVFNDISRGLTDEQISALRDTTDVILANIFKERC